MSVDIVKLRRAQPMYQAMANLFQFVGNDRFMPDKVRPYFERKLASTKFQRKMSLNHEHRQHILSDKRQFPDVLKLPANYKTDRFKREIEKYKSYYCWLSGIRIVDDRGNLHESDEIFNPGCSRSENLNEDEHAISFQLMLFFFGGISSLSEGDFYEREFDGYKRIILQLIEDGVIDRQLIETGERELLDREREIIEIYNNHVNGIQQTGADTNLHTRRYAFTTELLNLNRVP